jgi:hypothetical protein|tara:strand:+ start:164 stop:502 length:339 start_codon:yes stop_codon:yes gene_type:complete
MAVKKELKKLATNSNPAILHTMTDKNIHTEREATDDLREEIASVLGKIMGIAAFNPTNSKDQLKNVEAQINNALETHRKKTFAAQMDIEILTPVPDAQEEIRLALQHGMEGR